MGDSYDDDHDKDAGDTKHDEKVMMHDIRASLAIPTYGINNLPISGFPSVLIPHLGLYVI